MGIPDGVAPYVNEALIPKNVIRRLYIFSEKKLVPKTLRQIELFVITVPYPYPSLMLSRVCPLQPTHNFFVPELKPNMPDFSSFTEYRYFHKRSIPANILYQPNDKICFKFSPPSYCTAPTTIIMPSNFEPLDDFSGTITVGNYIIYITSKYLLTSINAKPQNAVNIQVNDIDLIDNFNVLKTIKDIFARMGVLNAYMASRKQYVGYDDYLTFTFGEFSV